MDTRSFSFARLCERLDCGSDEVGEIVVGQLKVDQIGQVSEERHRHGCAAALDRVKRVVGLETFVAWRRVDPVDALAELISVERQQDILVGVGTFSVEVAGAYELVAEVGRRVSGRESSEAQPRVEVGPKVVRKDVGVQPTFLHRLTDTTEQSVLARD